MTVVQKVLQTFVVEVNTFSPPSVLLAFVSVKSILSTEYSIRNIFLPLMAFKKYWYFSGVTLIDLI